MALVAAERQRESELQTKLLEAKERARFFHKPDAAADFDYWSKMAHWSIDEAVALSFGKAPSKVNQRSLKRFAVVELDGTPASPFATEYFLRVELAKRAVVWKQLFDPVLPGIFLAWARRLEIHAPPALSAAVESRGHWIGDWKDAHDKMKTAADTWQATAKDQAANIAELTNKVAQIAAERDELLALAKPPPKSELSTRERDTLLKLVIGMAVSGYRYDPTAARNEAPTEIAGDLVKLGIEVSDDTVRKWLKEAAATVLPRDAPKG